MYRIAVRNQDPESPDAAPFAWRRTFDNADEARAALPEAEAEFSPDAGYELAVEYLFTDGSGAGEWKALEP